MRANEKKCPYCGSINISYRSNNRRNIGFDKQPFGSSGPIVDKSLQYNMGHYHACHSPQDDPFEYHCEKCHKDFNL